MALSTPQDGSLVRSPTPRGPPKLAELERTWSKVDSTHFPPPKRSPFSLHSAEYIQTQQQDQVVKREFIYAFNNLALSATATPQMASLSGALEALGTETWMDILDFIDSPRDLLSLCRTSNFFYDICIGRLYKTVRIRSPFYPWDPACIFGKEFDRDKIPFNLLLTPLYFMGTRIPSKFPAPYQLAKHIQHLDIAFWDAMALAPHAVQTPPQMWMRHLRPDLVQYNLWRSHHRVGGIITLAVDKLPNGIVLSVDGYLADLLRESLSNLRSFSWLPVPRSTNKVIPPVLGLDSILNRGWITQHSHAFLTAIVWDQLKKMPRLQSLAVDFERSDPLLYERMVPEMPALTNYDPGKDGLVGFKNLVSLDLRGVGCGRANDLRFPEIARVIADCIASGTLRNFSLGLERWWYWLIEKYQIDQDKDLWDWIEDLWARCFVLAEARRKKKKNNPPPVLKINVKIDFVRTFWQFRTISDYALRPEMLVQMRIHSGHILEDGAQVLARLNRKHLPNLRVLFLKTFLTNAHKILKTTTGLRELYIVNPGSPDRFRAGALGTVKQRSVAYEESQIPIMDLTQMNWMLDTLVKNHLCSLEILVIDELMPVPLGDRGPGIMNSLAIWKHRGANIKELGLSLWGPWERIETFVTCFPSLKCFHLFNPPKLGGNLVIPDAPKNAQVAMIDSFLYTPYYCNAATMAYLISRVWAKDLIFKKAGIGRFRQAEATRWIRIGPWYIQDDTDWRWKWEEDMARMYIEQWRRPDFFGTIPGQEKVDKMTCKWLEVSKMWKLLEDYVPLKRTPARQ